MRGRQSQLEDSMDAELPNLIKKMLLFDERKLRHQTEPDVGAHDWPSTQEEDLAKFGRFKWEDDKEYTNPDNKLTPPFVIDNQT